VLAITVAVHSTTQFLRAAQPLAATANEVRQVAGRGNPESALAAGYDDNLVQPAAGAFMTEVIVMREECSS
jgi:hypothetical protein